MKSHDERKLELLENIEKLCCAINDELDWFIASFREKDSKRRRLAREIFLQKQKETVLLARRLNGKY